MYNSLSRILILTKRNIKEILRDPLSLIFTIFLPLFMEIMFYLLFHGMTTQFEMKYLAPGIVAFSQAFLTLFTGLLISLDRNSSFLTRLYVSKTKSYEFILAYCLSVLPISLTQSILFFIVGGIFDTSIFSFSMLIAILISVITSILFVALGILFGSLCNEKSIGGVSSIIITGQSLLSGIWFPTEGIGKGFLTFMKILPFKNATMLIQNTLNGISNAFEDFLLPLLILIFYTLATIITAILIFKNKMSSK